MRFFLSRVSMSFRSHFGSNLIQYRHLVTVKHQYKHTLIHIRDKKQTQREGLYLFEKLQMIGNIQETK